MPEIGSCISLISKADIRYEGLLFTVDPDRCTIALARVKSYGTEDRETQFPIAPQNQCYDYILFRGSDIKDIRVINNNPVPNDPAIMQMHLPPQQPLPPMQNKLGQPGFQPQPGFMMPPIGPGGPGPMGGPPPGHQPIGQPYSSFGGMNNLGESVLDLIGGGVGGASGAGGASGSRSTTPSNLLARKSPTVDMGVQTNQQQQGTGQQQQNTRDGNRSGGDGGNLDRGNMQPRNRNNSQRSQGQQQQRERRDSGKNDGQMKDNYNKNMQRQGGGNQNRGWHNNRGNNQNMNNNMRGRPRGRGGLPQGGNRAKNLLKFENDYDFEQANNKFEELRSQLSKLKVGDEAKPEQVSTEQMDKQKDDSGNETGAGDHEQEEDDLVCYDKAKSFFDNISCEAIERAKGKQQRTDWRQERKLNTETFGVGSTRRGGYNRRGGYYNRGPHNYRNNQYRGGNNYRGRSGNRPNQHNQPNGLPHNTSRLNTNQQQQQQAQQQQAASQQQHQQQQQQPAVIEVAAGK